MEKVYLLLRNNQQTGPYTIEEMLQQQLLPSDLVWIDGKSTAWVHPSEIDWSQPYITPATPVTANNIVGSKENTETAVSPAQSVPSSTPWHLTRRSPQAELEARALELRNTVQAAANTQRHYRTSTSPATTKRRRTVYETEENPVLLEVHTLGKKSVSLSQLIGAAVLTALLAAGWYNRESLTVIRPSQNILSTAATPAVFEVTPPPAPEVLQASVVDTGSPVVTETIAPAPVLTQQAQSRSKVDTKSFSENTASVPAATTASSTTVEPEPKEAVQTAVVTTPAPETKVVAAPVKDDKPATEIDAESGVKKKTLGQAIKSIFKKKKKEDADMDTPVTAQ